MQQRPQFACSQTCPCRQNFLCQDNKTTHQKWWPRDPRDNCAHHRQTKLWARVQAKQIAEQGLSTAGTTFGGWLGFFVLQAFFVTIHCSSHFFPLHSFFLCSLSCLPHLFSADAHCCVPGRAADETNLFKEKQKHKEETKKSVKVDNESRLSLLRCPPLAKLHLLQTQRTDDQEPANANSELPVAE